MLVRVGASSSKFANCFGPSVSGVLDLVVFRRRTNARHAHAHMHIDLDFSVHELNLHTFKRTKPPDLVISRIGRVS